MIPEMALLAELLDRTGPLPAALPCYSYDRPAAAFGFLVYDPIWSIIRSTEDGCRIPPIVLRRGASREEVDAAIRQKSPDSVILSSSVSITSIHPPEPSLRLMRDIALTAPWVLTQHPDIGDRIMGRLALEELVK